MRRLKLDPTSKIPMSVQRYKNASKQRNIENNKLGIEAKQLRRKNLLGRGVKSHAIHRTQNGSTPLTGVERASIYKKTCNGTVNIGDPRVLDWLDSNVNASR